MNTINLGDEARDTITGFQGVVVAITDWLHGCRRMTLQPREMRDGKVLDTMTFDEPQLELVSSKVAKTTDRTGGPMPTPSRSASPPRR